MPRLQRAFSCTECGALSPRWSGQCPDCGAWNTLQEVPLPGKVHRGGRPAGAAVDPAVCSIAEVSLHVEARLATGMGELDRVLGGGLVVGSVVLMGGDPGIGKSTLLLQSLAQLGSSCRALYVTGEESVQQVALRAHRLDLPEAGLRLLAETRVERILTALDQERPQVVVIDSIQTMYTELLQSAPGSVAQVRESAAVLVRYAKEHGAALFLVGHVTKEGALAGPRVLEHMVDAVLYFEGERGARYRVIRAVKNRFGAVNELGVFAMTDKGLRQVSNPSAMFLSGYRAAVPGSAVMATWEGTRPLLVEVQALADPSQLGNPRRLALGFDAGRLSMLLAVLHRHAGTATQDQDVFVNIVGGVRITETGADLPVLLAIRSSLYDRPLPERMLVFGEVGLAGEIRPVQGGLDRIKEAAKHGFQRALVPKANAPRAGARLGIEVLGVERLAEAVEGL